MSATCVGLSLGHQNWHSMLTLDIQADGKAQVCRLAWEHVCLLPATLPYLVLSGVIWKLARAALEVFPLVPLL